MKITEDLLIHYLHFSVILLGAIVFFDVLIRFNSPVKQKIYFLLIAVFSAISSLGSLIASGPDQFVLEIFTCKAIVGTSMVQIFTYLYFIRYKKIANLHSIFTVMYLLLLTFYALRNENMFPRHNAITSVMDQREFEFKIPVLGVTLSYFYLIFLII